MATRKKAAKKAVAKASGKRAAARRPVSKKPSAATKAGPAAKASKAPAIKARKTPETLRLTGFTPSLTVNDLNKSLAFYVDGLGFVIGEKWKDGETLLGVMLKAGATELGIMQDDWKMGKDRKKGVGFRIWADTTQDLDAVANRVKAAGFALTEEPNDNPAWNMRSFSVDDPDGFHISMGRKL